MVVFRSLIFKNAFIIIIMTSIWQAVTKGWHEKRKKRCWLFTLTLSGAHTFFGRRLPNLELQSSSLLLLPPWPNNHTKQRWWWWSSSSSSSTSSLIWSHLLSGSLIWNAVAVGLLPTLLCWTGQLFNSKSWTETIQIKPFNYNFSAVHLMCNSSTVHIFKCSMSLCERWNP